MALIVPNIGMSALLTPAGVIEAVLSKMDSVVLDIDGKLTPVYSGAGMYSIINISADRKPKVSLKGPEVPLTAAAGLLGAQTTVAAAGAPVQIPIVEEYTISAAGTVTLLNPLSATVFTIAVIGMLDGKPFSPIASAPTTGQFVTPAANATTITFSVTDANKPIAIQYTMDSTTGGSISILPTSIPGIHKFIANAKVVNTEDSTGALVPISFVVMKCQFIGNWQISQERQKASSTSIDLDILDPGGGLPAIQIITGSKFAG